MTGFLEESPGVKSMARLTIVLCLALAAPIVGTICGYVLYAVFHKATPDAAVIGALVGGLTALVGGGAVAIIK
ncbi:MAG TPA: hypothetical protein VFF44_12290, partial [Casimicrobiaceae bacterium]|nr:hypothetical protein [Casimicrobiaceae bacterium]